jgi:Domain of unknown function (DUF4375)
MPYESDPIAHRLNELVSSEELYMGLICFDRLNLAEKVLIGTWELVNEIYNGGFVQYFHNSSRDRAKPMVGILRSIQAKRAGDILEAALVVAGPGTASGDEPNFLSAVNSMPADVRNDLKVLEHNLYDELDNLHLQVFRYLSKHRDQINVPEDFWKESIIQ